MDYPARKRKRANETAGADEDAERLELELAELSAPFGEEMPWRVMVSDWREPGDAWREWRPERGRLH